MSTRSITAAATLALAAATLGCSGSGSSPSQNLATYTINVTVTGGFGATSVCATFQDNGNKLNPCSTIATGQTGQITVMASSGVSYTLTVPSGQTGPSCSVTSGGSGVFGSANPTAVVTCH